MSYNDVNKILHEQALAWSPFARPADAPVNLALDGGQSVESVADMLHQFVMNAFAGSAFYPTYEQASYSIFVENGHFWELNTSIALGQQVEAPVDKIAEARTVAEFLDNIAHGYNRLGYRDGNAVAPDSPEYAQRLAASRVPPPEWIAYKEIWELAIMSGSIPVGLTGFDPAYVQKSPKLREIRGLDAQQYLDNLWTPGTWKPTQAAK